MARHERDSSQRWTRHRERSRSPLLTRVPEAVQQRDSSRRWTRHHERSQSPLLTRVPEAVQRAEMAAAASAAATEAATGSSNQQAATSNWSHLAKAAAKSVERKQQAFAKAAAPNRRISNEQACASIIQKAQTMVHSGQRLVEVAAHEHRAGMELIAAGHALAATMLPPPMPPNDHKGSTTSTAMAPVAP